MINEQDIDKQRIGKGPFVQIVLIEVAFSFYRFCLNKSTSSSPCEAITKDKKTSHLVLNTLLRIRLRLTGVIPR